MWVGVGGGWGWAGGAAVICDAPTWVGSALRPGRLPGVGEARTGECWGSWGHDDHKRRKGSHLGRPRHSAETALEVH